MARQTGVEPSLRRAAALALLVAGAPALAEDPSAIPPAAGDASHRVVRDGVVVEFSISRAADAAGKEPLLEGDYAEVRFRMTDAATGRPVPSAKPAAWLDMAGVVGGRRGEEKACKDKIGLYLKGVVGIRPMVDLNAYYLLVLNQDASISVIDPVVSMTGNTSLYATVVMKRPAADWVKGRDDKRLYVSMPKAGEVAVVDAEAFKVIGDVPAGESPTRVALQPDGRYLWVGNDAASAELSGVTVIDTESLKPVATIRTGRGHHEIAFSTDGRLAFVGNRDEGTVSAIEVAGLKKLADLRTGPLPIALATSSLSQAIYVADGKAGTISVIDPARLEITARLAAKPGLGPTRFSQDGRWGFAVNPSARTVHVLDASTNELVHEIALEGQPYQVMTTRGFAYVRLLDSEQVKMVNLLSLGAGKKPIVQGFGAGTAAPQAAGGLSLADSVSPAATEAAVFAVNPADGNTYFYMEGMNAPMGTFGSYGHQARAVTVVDRSLKETEPGLYTGKLRIPVAGQYDVAFLLENPRVVHCFATTALPNAGLRRGQGELALEFVSPPLGAPVAAGQRVAYRFRLYEPTSREPRIGLRGVQVLYYVMPGREKNRAEAREVEPGVYEASLPLTRPGVWYAFAEVPSASVKVNELAFRTFHATPETPPHAGEKEHRP